MALTKFCIQHASASKLGYWLHFSLISIFTCFASFGWIFLVICCGDEPRMAVWQALSILDIECDASWREIKKAYRRQSLKFHPERCHMHHAKCMDMFTMIRKAYDALHDIEPEPLCTKNAPILRVGDILTLCLYVVALAAVMRHVWSMRHSANATDHVHKKSETPSVEAAGNVQHENEYVFVHSQVHGMRSIIESVKQEQVVVAEQEQEQWCMIHEQERPRDHNGSDEVDSEADAHSKKEPVSSQTTDVSENAYDPKWYYLWNETFWEFLLTLILLYLIYVVIASSSWYKKYIPFSMQ